MSDWRRLHPLTPLLRGGRFLVFAAAVAGQQSARAGAVDADLVVAGGAVGFTVAVLVGGLAWWTMRYRLTDTEMQVESGVRRRRSRRVPLARVQSVDVVRPLVARLLGLAELRLEVVGGGKTEAPLAYLAEAEARALRAELLARVAGRPASGAAPELPLVTVPTSALVGSLLLGTPALLCGVLLVTGGGALLVDPATGMAVLGAGVPALVGTGWYTVHRLLGEYGFRVAETDDGLRLRHGLLDTRSSTVPAGRVQTARIIEPLLWRTIGWVRVEVDVAGYATRGGGTEQVVTTALLPVAPRQLGLALLERVLGAPLPAGRAPVPPRARWRAPLQAHRLGVGVDDRHVLTTRGVLTTTTDIVPLAKLQSLRISAGPWQRRLRLASVHVDSAGRRLPGATAAHRDADDAAALLDHLTDAARTARGAGPAGRGRP